MKIEENLEMKYSEGADATTVEIGNEPHQQSNHFKKGYHTIAP